MKNKFLLALIFLCSFVSLNAMDCFMDLFCCGKISHETNRRSAVLDCTANENRPARLALDEVTKKMNNIELKNAPLSSTLELSKTQTLKIRQRQSENDRRLIENERRLALVEKLSRRML
jgi:TolA-binding protein